MENSLENKRVEIGPEALGYFDTTRKWTMFFAILGFVFLGLMLVFGLLAGSLIRRFTSGMSGMSEMQGMEGMNSMGAAGGMVTIMMFIVFLIMAVIYFFPLFYLLKFSQHAKRAVATCDSNEMTLAFRNIKSYWKYMGILVIILLAVYLIIFIIAGASMAFLTGIK
jgi:ABC-type multidrug transport system fused ATPase/permease subunit